MEPKPSSYPLTSTGWSLRSIRYRLLAPFVTVYTVAAAFAGCVYALSLMNEPHDSDCMSEQTAQAGLEAIRKADRERLVLAPGDQWSEASKWPPRVIYEAHEYFDADHRDL